MMLERKRGRWMPASDARHASRVTRAVAYVACVACIAPALVLAAACTKPPAEPVANTGARATVARIVIETSKLTVSASAHDSTVFRGQAYDNEGGPLDLQLSWRSDPASVFGIDPFTGHGAGQSAGSAIVWATAGSATSNRVTVTVRP